MTAMVVLAVIALVVGVVVFLRLRKLDQATLVVSSPQFAKSDVGERMHVNGKRYRVTEVISATCVRVRRG